MNVKKLFNIKTIIITILLFSLVCTVNADSYNVFYDGGFSAGNVNWNPYAYGTGSYVSNIAGGVRLTASTGSGSAVARVGQTIDLTGVNTISVIYYNDADWDSSYALFRVEIDGPGGTVIYSSNAYYNTWHTENIDISGLGLTGNHEVWFYVYKASSTGSPDTAYIDNIEGLATIIPSTSLYIKQDGKTSKGYYAPEDIVSLTSNYVDGIPPVTASSITVVSGTEGIDWDYISTGNNYSNIQFHTNGNYNINTTLYSVYGYGSPIIYTLTNSTTAFINISGTTYDWTLDFYDTSGNPITTTLDLVLYTDTVLNTTSTTTGTIKYYDLLSGSYACEISSGGSYITETEYVVLAADTETNVTLTAYSNYQNIFPSPNVKCNFRGSYGQALVNYTIYCAYVNSSGPASWFSSLFGYSDTTFIAESIVQVTDEGGNVVLPFVPTATYTIQVYPNGLYGPLLGSFQFNPVQNGEYSFRIDTLDYVVWNGTANPYINVVNSSVFLIGVNYNDTSLSTTAIEFFVNVNGSQEYKETLGGIQAYNFSTEINNTKGVRYTWGIIAQTGVYGNITVADSITARGGEKLVDLGIDADYPDIYVWVSVFILIIFGAIFSQTTAEYGAIALCFLGGGLYYIDWFDGEVRILRVGIAMTVAIVYFVKTKYRRD